MWTICKSLLTFLKYCFYFMFCFFGYKAHGISTPYQRSNPPPLHWKVNHLPTREVPSHDLIYEFFLSQTHSNRVEWWLPKVPITLIVHIVNFLKLTKSAFHVQKAASVWGGQPAQSVIHSEYVVDGRRRRHLWFVRLPHLKALKWGMQWECLACSWCSNICCEWMAVRKQMTHGTPFCLVQSLL